MGEMLLSLKGRLSGDADKAAKQAESLQSFMDECQTAYKFWQDRRFKGDSDGFWSEMERRFPQAFAFLSWRFQGKHRDNGLVGVLSFSETCSTRGFNVKGRNWVYHTECWHFAETGPITTYLAEKFGLEKTVYIVSGY